MWQVIDRIKSELKGVIHTQNNIAVDRTQSIKDLKELYGKKVNRQRNGQEIFDTRTLKSIDRQIMKEASSQEVEQIKQQALSELLAEEADKAREKASLTLKSSLGEAREKADTCKQERDRLWQEHQDKDIELGKFNSQAERQRVILVTFNKMKSEDIISFLKDPTAPEFRKLNSEIVKALGCYEEWEKAKHKANEESRKNQAKAQRERQKAIQYKKKFQEQAIRICQGKAPFPDELKRLHTPQTIDIQTLSWFLRNKHEKETAVNA